MALADSTTAIGAVSALLRTQLGSPNTSAGSVQVGRPEEAAGSNTGSRLNLFLYQIGHDGSLRNHPLDKGQPTPIWLVLHYLLTAFDSDGESDTAGSHELLGQGLVALQGLNFIHPTAAALVDNPEPLKVTFDNADTELLSQVMQGSEEHYRVSAAFQVRPVMLASGEPPSYAPAVRTVGPDDAGAEVLPSLGPRLDGLSPERFEAGDQITLSGQDLGSEVTEICLGSACYPVTAAPPGQLKTVIPSDTELSAGSYAVSAVKPLASGRTMASNAVLGHLLPTLEDASAVDLSADGSEVEGTLELSGQRLGGADDAIFVAFWRQGAVELMVEAGGEAAQTELAVEDVSLPPDTYRIILRVNGEQAIASPEVDWTV